VDVPAADPLASLYDRKAAEYSARARADLLDLLPERVDRLLDLGSATGATSRLAKQRGLASEIRATDLVEPSSDNMGSGGIDTFVRGNIETLPASAFGGSFDAILCADVLEHLVDPWATVRKLHGLLRPRGLLLASVPNFRNHRVLREIILGGSFRYQPAGILDESHLRFFCRKDVVGLFEGAGFDVETVSCNMGGYGLRNKVWVWASLGGLRDFFVFQFLLRCRKL
jgi:SAM-dependent methyltransferase